ncbi:hypothetical protein Pcaca05_39640 [Pectobacterium carotovorum subsp. carotovorum]|nr:hypothetical protein Pcaca05_39640 [Pectobacterium carotovorum subsp. carotovorum]
MNVFLIKMIQKNILTYNKINKKKKLTAIYASHSLPFHQPQLYIIFAMYNKKSIKFRGEILFRQVACCP